MTDDTGLVEVMGEPVVVVDEDMLTLKITTTVDLALAELLVDSSLRWRASPFPRVSIDLD